MVTESDTKICSLCAEPVAATAIRCRHCDGYQGRWFFLTLSTPVLSLLVALVSILALAIPALRGALAQPDCQVRVAFQYFEDGTAHFVASNPGTRPGSVGEVYLDYGFQDQRYALRGQSKQRIIAPNASVEMAFILTCPSDLGPQVQYSSDEGWGSRPIANGAQLKVVVVQFDGSSSTQVTPIGELGGIRAIADRHHQCVQEALARKTAKVPK